MALHARTHPSLDVEGCFGCKVAGVRFGGLVRLANERAIGMTQADMGREVVEQAKKDGREIQPKNRWI